VYNNFKKRATENQISNIDINKKEFEKFKNDKNYIDVEFNETNGALKATHKDHNFDPTKSPINEKITRGDYEKISRDILFENGHSIILRAENTQEKTSDGKLDYKNVEIKGVESTSKRNIRDKFFEASKQGAVSIILYFVSDFLPDELYRQYGDYIRVSKSNKIKDVYYIVKGKLYKI
jgi:hypothetical protein